MMRWPTRLAAATLEGFGRRLSLIFRLLCQDHNSVTFSHKLVGISNYIARKSYALFIVQEKRIFGRQKISSVQDTSHSCSLDSEESFGGNISPPLASGHEPNLRELG